ncbi:hypothetical protein FRB99_006350 [Tulasnella sp. 403]|nr:hypothetical protein FRB99_006350 [Tulasnella sp. 403]
MVIRLALSHQSYVPQSVADELYSMVRGAVRGRDGMFSLPCDADIPQLFFRLVDSKRTVDTEIYKLFPVEGRREYCYSGIPADPEMEMSYAIIGASVPRTHYLAFDKENERIGFAELAEPSVSWFDD